MTVEQAAQNLGVSVETLVREVTSKQTAWHTVCTVIIVLAFLAVTAPETTAREYIVENYKGGIT